MSNVVNNIQTYPSTTTIQSWAVIRKKIQIRRPEMEAMRFRKQPQVTS